MVQKLKAALVTKSDDFRSLLRSHMREELTPTNCPLLSSRPRWQTHIFLKEILMTVVCVVGEHVGAASICANTRLD